MINKYNQYLKKDNLMKKTLIFTMSMGNLAMFPLTRLSMLVSMLEVAMCRVFSRCWSVISLLVLGFTCFIPEKNCSHKYVLFVGILCKVSNAQRSL
jgi:hypothetical protein